MLIGALLRDRRVLDDQIKVHFVGRISSDRCFRFPLRLRPRLRRRLCRSQRLPIPVESYSQSARALPFNWPPAPSLSLAVSLRLPRPLRGAIDVARLPQSHISDGYLTQLLDTYAMIMIALASP